MVGDRQCVREGDGGERCKLKDCRTNILLVIL
jgi:hypothetical protein